MIKFFYLILFAVFLVNSNASVNAKENFFDKAIKLYNNKNYEDSKFLLQRNIVFNPKDHLSYLYLAKIYKEEKNDKELKKNLDTALLLNPKNEEALYMLIDIELKKSNFSEVKKLTKNFEIICSTFCDKTKNINERLKNIEAKDESKQ